MDCFEGLKLLEDNSVTITICSPPYNITSSRGKLYDKYEDNLSDEEYFQFLLKAIMELIRVSKYYVFFNIQYLKENKKIISRLHYELIDYIKEVIIWNKSNVMPSAQETCLNSKWEYVFVFTTPEMAKNRTFEYAFFNNKIKGPLNNNIFETPNSSVERFEGRKECKAIYPRKFVYWFLKKFTQEGDLVLDCFSGLGTTAVTCKKMNRNFIGFELSPRYCEITNWRLENLDVQNWKFLGEV